MPNKRKTSSSSTKTTRSTKKKKRKKLKNNNVNIHKEEAKKAKNKKRIIVMRREDFKPKKRKSEAQIQSEVIRLEEGDVITILILLWTTADKIDGAVNYKSIPFEFYNKYELFVSEKPKNKPSESRVFQEVEINSQPPRKKSKAEDNKYQIKLIDILPPSEEVPSHSELLVIKNYKRLNEELIIKIICDEKMTKTFDNKNLEQFPNTKFNGEYFINGFCKNCYCKVFNHDEIVYISTSTDPPKIVVKKKQDPDVYYDNISIAPIQYISESNAPSTCQDVKCTCDISISIGKRYKNCKIPFSSGSAYEDEFVVFDGGHLKYEWMDSISPYYFWEYAHIRMCRYYGEYFCADGLPVPEFSQPPSDFQSLDKLEEYLHNKVNFQNEIIIFKLLSELNVFNTHGDANAIFISIRNCCLDHNFRAYYQSGNKSEMIHIFQDKMKKIKHYKRLKARKSLRLAIKAVIIICRFQCLVKMHSFKEDDRNIGNALKDVNKDPTLLSDSSSSFNFDNFLD